MIKLIIFDWDDVFTQGSTKGYYACYRAAVEGVGVHLSEEELDTRIRSKWGSPHRQEILALLAENPELVDEAVEIYEKALFGDVFVNELTFIEGGQSLLEDLSSRYTLTVASGVHPKVLIERVFPKFEVPEVFSEIVTAYDLDDPEKSKPDPHSIELILERTGISPTETLMVGDAENDIKMGKNAGTHTAAVLTGHMSKADAEASGADAIIPDVTELPQAIASLEDSGE